MKDRRFQNSLDQAHNHVRQLVKKRRPIVLDSYTAVGFELEYGRLLETLSTLIPLGYETRITDLKTGEIVG